LPLATFDTNVVGRSVLNFVTDFGDQAVILPLVTGIALVLLAHRRLRLAAAWLLATTGVLAAILALKVFFYACNRIVPAWLDNGLHLVSPSGHTASAAVAYGGIVVLAAGRTVPRRVLAVAVSGIVAGVIGATRLQLAAHSPPEVIIGAVIGVAGSMGFACLVRCGDASPRPSVIAAAALILALFHGRHLNGEGIIRVEALHVVRQVATFCRPEPKAAVPRWQGGPS
jgi:membrane-associated phospholipid phosphatase